MDHSDLQSMRRGIAAINLLISGPTLLGALDPAHVLTGAGTGFTAAEKEAFSAKLARYNRHMVFQEYSSKDGNLSYDRLHVVAANSKGVWWWSDCMYWTPGPTAEVALIPFDEGAKGHFVNRGGALKYVGSRPQVTHEGIVRAAKRMAGIVERLSANDCDGQVRDDLPGRGLRYWQREGFRLRLDS